MKKYWYACETENAAKGTDTDENTHSEAKNRIESFNNDIYFYAGVSRTNNLTLNKKIDSLSTKYINFANSLSVEEIAPIRLHINSYGGSVFAGLSTVDYILTSAAPVHTIIEGCAASTATLFSIVGDHRMMHRHSFMLIHQISSGMWGKFEELKDDMENNKLIMEMIKELYQEHTKIPKNKLTEILKHDLWWDAKTCLKYGLVDEVI